MQTIGEFNKALIEAIGRAGLDTVDGAFSHTGDGDMTIPGLGHRQRWRMRLATGDGRECELFMKRYGREPLLWRLQRWWTYGRSGSPAEVELNNIRAAKAGGVSTIPAALGGSQKGLLGPKRSYILMTAVPGTALEQSLDPFLNHHGLDSDAVRQFTLDLATLVRKFHRGGFVHRDLYTSHIFLDDSPQGASLHLIDLARVFAPRLRRFRWRVKDLAQLKYSMPEPWVEKYWDSFLARYFDEQDTLRAKYERAIDRKVVLIARHDARLRARRAEWGTDPS